MGSTRQLKPPHALGRSFFWQGLLILLPLAVLAAIGFWFLSEQRAAAREKAIQETTRSAQNIADKLNELLREVSDVSHPSVPLDPDQAKVPYLYSLNPLPPKNLDPDKHYRSGLTLLEAGRTEEAATAFSYTPDVDNAFSSSGIPLFALIRFHQLMALPADFPKSELRDKLNHLDVTLTRTHPSILSLPMLKAVEEKYRGFDRGDGLNERLDYRKLDKVKLKEGHLKQNWLYMLEAMFPLNDPIAEWQLQEGFRRILRQHIEEIRRDRTSKWITDENGASWRLDVLNTRRDPSHQRVVHANRSSYLEKHVGVIANSRLYFPESDYASIRVNYDGRTLFPPPAKLAQLKNFEPVATANKGLVEVSSFLTNYGLIHAQQRRETIWFVSIIALAAFTAIFGLWVTRRAYLKQEAMNRMKSNFVSSVSHELRAPIASIRLMAERLGAGNVNDEKKRGEYFGFIEQESRRLSNLVENVLDFSRIEDGKKTYSFEETDVAQLAEETTRLMEPHAAEHKVNLATRFHPPRELPCIDPMEIQQALVNLIDNAIKYSGQGRTVTIGLENGSPDKFNLWVEDEGPGIPRQEQSKIFDRFYRVGSELERETEGVGIGLSIVRHTAEAHGGAITIDSTPGKGSRFTLELPIRPPKHS